MIRTFAVTLAIGMALATPALAARGNETLKRSCSGDAATFCGDLDPGSRQMEACFKKHRRELSPGCARAIDAYRSKGGR